MAIGDLTMSQSDENPKHIQAMKDGKAPLEYLVDFVMTGDAYVHQNGAIKYGYRNWIIDKIKLSTYIAAMRRHLKAVSEGEDLDPDSGWHHLYHIRAGAAIVLDAENAGTLIDDRGRAESISQDKEEQETCTWIVRYTVHPDSNAMDAPMARTRCFGPFNTFVNAKKFVKGNAHKEMGHASIDTVSSI
jgi:hypothetical protein